MANSTLRATVCMELWNSLGPESMSVLLSVCMLVLAPNSAHRGSGKSHSQDIYIMSAAPYVPTRAHQHAPSSDAMLQMALGAALGIFQSSFDIPDSRKLCSPYASRIPREQLDAALMPAAAHFLHYPSQIYAISDASHAFLTRRQRPNRIPPPARCAQDALVVPQRVAAAAAVPIPLPPLV
ncbi:hypothetical protein B0H15DRAFT_944836 [Mycena belliarum]|uniref:Uncharacterized protein n=1 Tax=Mycena belliarum TaxID=1033014 RepID=A0AAD6UEC3_9AGAR|nr:hypothetical protein B0H15DRAFT_944802 [Mycena belliae]KAJ7099396.1 hypothetical protein B0H15DRAFT_944806 [Mycena belliae]KAJ7099416.1 hypothetical protein B0H15DRAFT_944836 [Mycena belliae]